MGEEDTQHFVPGFGQQFLGVSGIGNGLSLLRVTVNRLEVRYEQRRGAIL